MKKFNIKKMIPDKLFLQLFYYKTFKKKLNLKNPRTFSEKLQWLKLYDRNPEYIKLVDKQEVKKIVSDIIGEKYIIPTLGVWDNFQDINFDNLPNKFVLKCTHDSGGIVVVRNKEELDLENAKKVIEDSLNRNYFYICREWPYKNVKPRVIAEKFMSNESKMLNGENLPEGLIDYKFYCFDGKPEFLYVSKGMENHETARVSFLNIDWTFANFKRNDYMSFEKLPNKPSKYDEMIEIATCLSKGFKFIRVDLYEIDNEIYFSELTLYPCGGFQPFEPDKYDLELGNLLELPNE